MNVPIMAAAAISASNNALTARNLSTMNNNECKYQIRVQGGYQCMTKVEYDLYRNTPPTKTEYVLQNIMMIFLVVFVFGLCWFSYKAIKAMIN